MKIELNEKEIETLQYVIENEVKSDLDMLEHKEDFSFEKDDVDFWTNEVNLLKGIKEKLNDKQLIIKGLLTAEQEDYMIESYLEMERERREGNY